jgi:hypothetical protein
MPDLSVAFDHHEITVSKPSLGLSITYRRQGRILEAVDPLRIDPSAEELIFLVTELHVGSSCMAVIFHVTV